METKAGSPAERFITSQATITLPRAIEVWKARMATAAQIPKPMATPVTLAGRRKPMPSASVRANMNAVAQPNTATTSAEGMQRCRSAIFDTHTDSPKDRTATGNCCSKTSLVGCEIVFTFPGGDATAVYPPLVAFHFQIFLSIVHSQRVLNDRVLCEGIQRFGEGAR